MKALITGASGFVGRHLLAHLEDCGDDVIGVDRECDVTDVASVNEVLRRTMPDAIFHLAALTHVGECREMKDGVGHGAAKHLIHTRHVGDVTFAVHTDDVITAVL